MCLSDAAIQSTPSLKRMGKGGPSEWHRNNTSLLQFRKRWVLHLRIHAACKLCKMLHGSALGPLKVAPGGLRSLPPGRSAAKGSIGAWGKKGERRGSNCSEDDTCHPGHVLGATKADVAPSGQSYSPGPRNVNGEHIFLLIQTSWQNYQESYRSHILPYGPHLTCSLLQVSGICPFRDP